MTRFSLFWPFFDLINHLSPLSLNRLPINSHGISIRLLAKTASPSLSLSPAFLLDSLKVSII